MLHSLGKNIQGLGSCSTAWVKTSRAWVNSPLPRLMLHSLGSCSTAWVKTSRAWVNSPLPRLMLHSLGKNIQGLGSCSTAWVKAPGLGLMLPTLGKNLHSPAQVTQPRTTLPNPGSLPPALDLPPHPSLRHPALGSLASRTLPTIRTCVPTLKHPSPGYTPPSAAPRVSCPWYRKLNSVPLKDPGGEREAIRARGPVSGASLPPCPRLGGWDSVAFLKVFCGRAPGTPAWGEGVGGARAHGRQKLGSRADFQ
ncbi:hypothetical protein Q8A73_023958 [Channa argus]|nr:hypothetical protein Q8A73_024475 [Channa argus]KAK2875881.1 hypothetical protein Q8A73_023958 [Channa argus]